MVSDQAAKEVKPQDKTLRQYEFGLITDEQQPLLEQPVLDLTRLDRATILRLQATVGNRATRQLLLRQTDTRSARDDNLSQPVRRPDISPFEDSMKGDAERIGHSLKERDLEAGDQQRILDYLRFYNELDKKYTLESGYTESDHLDRFLFWLKMTTVRRSSWRTLWQDQLESAYALLWHTLTGDYLAQFQQYVSCSKKQGTVRPDLNLEDFSWKELGKQELMGMFGMVKGIGLGIAGLSDAGASGLTWMLRKIGLDMEDPASMSQFLAEQYDELGQMTFGDDYSKKNDLFLGMNAEQVGTFGGRIISTLLTVSAGTGTVGVGGNTMKLGAEVSSKVAETSHLIKYGTAAISVFGSLDTLSKSTSNIVDILIRIKKASPDGRLDIGTVLSDPEFGKEVFTIAASVLSLASQGKDLGGAFKSMQGPFARIGIALDAGQTAIAATQMTKIAMSDLDEDKKNKAASEAMFGLMTSAVSTSIGIKNYRDSLPGESAKQEQARVSYDEVTLKNLVIEKWASNWDSGGRLVKVVQKGKGHTIGENGSVRGYVTEEKFILGRTPAEIEKILGLKSGDLSHGADIIRIGDVPTPDSFDFIRPTGRPPGTPAGYTNVPGSPDYPVGSGASQWYLNAGSVEHIISLDSDTIYKGSLHNTANNNGGEGLAVSALPAEKLWWGTWGDYPKTRVDGQECAIIGNRPYSHHAVNRMQPSGLRYSSTETKMPGIRQPDGTPPNKLEPDLGRSISPNFVEDVIAHSVPTKQSNGNLSYQSDSVRVVVSPRGVVITIETHH